MSKSLVEQTTDRLLDLIKEKDYQVGDKLMNEYELAEALDEAVVRFVKLFVV